MQLNHLVKAVWKKLRETCWSTKKVIQHLEASPLTLHSLYLEKIEIIQLSKNIFSKKYLFSYTAFAVSELDDEQIISDTLQGTSNCIHY